MADHESWTIRRTLEWTRGYLERKGDEHPRLSSEWLLSAVTGLSRVQLYVNYDKPLERDELTQLHGLIERRAAGEPLQYVTGEMPFRHIVLTCAPGVLIPRPETEVLVDVVLEHLDVMPKGDGESARVLEVGTGTGCIACSIASERPGVSVVATDLSPDAVALAVRNRDALGLEDFVEVCEGDLAEGVDPSFMGAFSALVSNPPYIPTAVIDTLPNEVAGFEPHLALDGGADGLDVFRRLVDLAPEALAPGGLLACELFEDSLEAATAIVRSCDGWDDVRVVKDLTGRDRIIAATREG